MNQLTMHQAVQEDVERLADLRALVLYDDLTRLGRYDGEGSGTFPEHIRSDLYMDYTAGGFTCRLCVTEAYG
ncbi:hypothetical protein [Paenibacillus illinoisensis]|uniref:hypothetical protein n=1 Tax=Paenibacillus illinoisensis TaxID=59845 RepID=UPI0030161044